MVYDDSITSSLERTKKVECLKEELDLLTEEYKSKIDACILGSRTTQFLISTTTTLTIPRPTPINADVQSICDCGGSRYFASTKTPTTTTFLYFLLKTCCY